MIKKILNFVLALTFIVLVALFAYKMTKAPEVLKVSVHEIPINEQAQEKKDIATNVADIEQSIKSYIMNHPEVIMQSLEEFNNKKLAESGKKASEYLNENKVQIEQAESPPILGNQNGDIVIVAFYDYNCSFCKKANDYENEIIASDPGVKVVLRPIPILGESSMYAAKVALAVQKVSAENFQNIHNELMKMKEINEDNVKALLLKYNIDYALVENEVNSYSVKQIISQNFDFARELGIKGTPSYVINGNFAPGLITTDKFKTIIVQLRASEEQAASATENKPNSEDNKAEESKSKDTGIK